MTKKNIWHRIWPNYPKRSIHAWFVKRAHNKYVKALNAERILVENATYCPYYNKVKSGCEILKLNPDFPKCKKRKLYEICERFKWQADMNIKIFGQMELTNRQKKDIIDLTKIPKKSTVNLNEDLNPKTKYDVKDQIIDEYEKIYNEALHQHDDPEPEVEYVQNHIKGEHPNLIIYDEEEPKVEFEEEKEKNLFRTT